MSPDAAAGLIAAVAEWVRGRGDCRALAVVGSWARGQARADSDLDLLVLTDRAESRWTDAGWLGGIDFRAAGHVIDGRRTVRYGAVLSHHLSLQPAAEVELSLAAPEWAATDPVDAGTRQVVRNGFRVVVDQDGRLRRLLAALAEERVLPAEKPGGEAQYPSRSMRLRSSLR